MADEAAVQALRRRRDAVRRWFLVSFLVLFLFGAGLRFSGGRVAGIWPDTMAIFLGVLNLVAATLAWMWYGWRLHRLADPWKYDPDLDGPNQDHPQGSEFWRR